MFESLILIFIYYESCLGNFTIDSKLYELRFVRAEVDIRKGESIVSREKYISFYDKEINGTRYNLEPNYIIRPALHNRYYQVEHFLTIADRDWHRGEYGWLRIHDTYSKFTLLDGKKLCPLE